MTAKMSPAAPRVPGEAGLWVFILGEMSVFAVLFINYMYYRGQDRALFESAQRTLNLNTGALFTFLLLISSFFVLIAVRALREGLHRTGQGFLLGAAVCGLLFCSLKISDYHAKLAHGITPRTNDFQMFFFVYTGIHLFHVILGLLGLGALIRLAGRSEGLSAGQILFVEGVACYWHMVDVLWVVLFALLYLVR